MINNRGSDEKRGSDRGGKEDALFVKIGKYAAIGLEFPSTVLGGLFLGYALDRYFNSSPWFTGSLTLLALIGAFIRLFQLLRRFSGEDK